MSMIIALPLLGGCALAPEHKRPVSTRVSEQLVPETTVGRMFASPFLIVIGAGAILVDAAIIHPLSIVDDAWRDTARYCWQGFGEPGRFVTDRASFPVRAVGMAPVYLTDYSIRLFADMPPAPRGDPETQRIAAAPADEGS